MLGYALTWAGRGEEAEAELIVVGTQASNDGERAQAAAPRVGNLFWTLARPAQAQQVLAAVLSGLSDEVARLDLVALGSVLDGWLARPERAAAAARSVLDDPRRSAGAETFACWGLVTARGSLGRLDGVATAVTRAVGATDSFGAVQLRTESARCGCAPGRSPDCSTTRGSPRCRCPDPRPRPAARRTSSPWPCPACWLCTAARCGPRPPGCARASPARTARTRAGWGYLLPLMLTAALGMGGDATAARDCLTATVAARHPAFVFLDPDLLLARAWVAAAEGARTAAVGLAVEAAELAAAQTQPAVEVLVLQTAVRFGDITPADRLAGLVSRVDGPHGPRSPCTRPRWPPRTARARPRRRPTPRRWPPATRRPARLV